MKVIFHLSSNDTSKQSELLGNVQNLMDDPEVSTDKISVVLNASAVDMVKNNSQASEYLEEYIENDVEINACSNSLENREIEDSEILEGVKKASSGVGRVAELQEEDFNYIRV